MPLLCKIRSWLPRVRPQLFFETGLAHDMPGAGNAWQGRLIGDGSAGGGGAHSAACVLLPSPEPRGPLPHIRAVAGLWLCYLCPNPPGSSSLCTLLSWLASSFWTRLPKFAMCSDPVLTLSHDTNSGAVMNLQLPTVPLRVAGPPARLYSSPMWSSRRTQAAAKFCPEAGRPPVSVKGGWLSRLLGTRGWFPPW